MTVKNILPSLVEEGWNVQEEFLNDLGVSSSYQAVVETLLNTDIKEYGLPSLTNEGKGKVNNVKTPIILQVTNARNVSAPKINEESGAAPRMLRLTLTDGSNYIHGVEVSFIKSLSLKVAPGTKIKVVSKVQLAGGHLLLTPSNTQVLGGVVDELYQKWKLSQGVSKYVRTTIASDGSGPPPWVSFGRNIVVEREEDFKALSDANPTKKSDDNFEQNRNKTVSELTKEGSQKVFGGGRQMLDSNVQKVISAGGFTIEEAEWALKKNKNDARKAIQELRRIQMGDDGHERDTYEDQPRDRGRGRGGKRGRGRKGPDNKGPDGSDDDDPSIVAPRPSRPASLFDFLDSKFRVSSGQNSQGSHHDDFHSKDDSYSRGRRGHSDRYGSKRQYATGRSRTQTTSNYSEPPMSQENWPTLGQEPEAEIKKCHSVPQDRPQQEPTRNPEPYRQSQSNSYAADRNAYDRSDYYSGNDRNQGYSDHRSKNKQNHYDYSDNQRARGDIPPYKYNQQLRYDNHESKYDNQRSNYNNQRPQYGNQQPYDYQQSRFDHRQPHYSNQHPRYDQQQSRYNYQQSKYDNQQSQFSNPQSRYDRPQPRHDPPQPRYNSRQANDAGQPKQHNQYFNGRSVHSHQQKNTSVGTSGGPTANQLELIAQFEKCMISEGLYDSETPSRDNVRFQKPSSNYDENWDKNNYGSSTGTGNNSRDSYGYQRGGGAPRRSRGRRGRY